MNDTTLIILIVWAGTAFWLPGLFCRLGRAWFHLIPAAVTVLVCVILPVTGAASWSESLAYAAYCAALYALSCSITRVTRQAGRCLGVELPLAFLGVTMFGGLLLFDPSGSERGSTVLMMMSPPSVIYTIFGRDILRSLFYNVSPLSTLFILTPAWWRCLVAAAVPAVLLLAGSVGFERLRAARTSEVEAS